MKKVSLLISILVISFSLYAESGIPVESNIKKPSINNEIVINHAMIEKFNNADYSEDQVSFSDLIEVYSFQEIKQISQAYHTGNIEVISKTSIAEYRKANQENDNWLHLYSESASAETTK